MTHSTSKLTEIINTTGFTEYAIQIHNVDFSAKPFEALLSIVDMEGSAEEIYVRMTIKDLKEFSITESSYLEYFDLQTAHPLLWNYTGPQCDLYIKGKPISTEKLFFELWNIHNTAYGNWRAFNSHMLMIASGGQGLFCREPQDLTKIYSNKLNEHGVETSIIDTHELKAYNFKVFFLGKNYFIGDGFEFAIQPNSALSND